MATIYRNTIKAFHGSWQSGVAVLEFEQGNSVHCENTSTARALDGMADCIAPGHSIDNGKLAGLDVVWFMDDMGLMLGGLGSYDSYLDNGNPEIELGLSIELD